MTPVPQLFRWDADAMVMRPLRPRAVAHVYANGELYRLGAIEERSAVSHRHYFATLAEAWANLPEDIAEQYPTAEHLRKRALIQEGFCDQRSIVCVRKAEAQRIAAFIRPMDTYAVVQVSEATVRVYTAQSQSARAMSASTFQASKEAVLGRVAQMVGVSRETLTKNAGVAA